MSWRGQGGKRAKGRRGDQDPELDNTAWLAELEREAAARGDDEDEDDWASTLRGRRSAGPDPAAAPAPPPPGPSWVPDPGPPPPDDRSYGLGADDAGTQAPGGGVYEPGRTTYGSDAWSAGPGPPPPSPDPDPGWSWSDAGSGTDWGGSQGDPEEGSWRTAGVDTPTGTWEPVEPVGREPDYPALFGELYRRGADQQDPIWEAPPATEPLPPEQGPPDPQPSSWPFEETTQSWEPTDGSFIWPADELPSTSAEWNTPAPPSWLDDPGPGASPPAAPSATPSPSGPDVDQTAAWSSPGPPFASPGPAAVPPGPPPAVPPGPPPADWASAIPTDVPAARRAADPGSTRAWRPDEAVEAEPGVPLGPGSRPPAGEGASSRMARLRGPGEEGPVPRDPVSRAFGIRAADRAVPVPDTEPDDEPRRRRRQRQAGERQARAWPRIVAVISWIVLVMVICWFYVFPWLERVLPENF